MPTRRLWSPHRHLLLSFKTAQCGKPSAPHCEAAVGKSMEARQCSAHSSPGSPQCGGQGQIAPHLLDCTRVLSSGNALKAVPPGHGHRKWGRYCRVCSQVEAPAPATRRSQGGEAIRGQLQGRSWSRQVQLIERPQLGVQPLCTPYTKPADGSSAPQAGLTSTRPIHRP